MLTEGDVVRGHPPIFDRAEHDLMRLGGPRGSKELPPDACLSGHVKPRFLLGWEPGRGRSFACTVEGCRSVQYRR